MAIDLKNPKTFQVLSVSTAHITKKDGEQLAKDFKVDLNLSSFPCVYEYDEGAFVYCDYQQVQHFPSFSTEFNDIIEFARKKGYTYVCFDANAVRYAELTEFVW